MPYFCISNARMTFSIDAHRGSLAPHSSTPQTTNKPLRKLRHSLKAVEKQDSAPRDGLVAQEMKRRSILLAAPLLFLPVTGCSSGGFYDTGITENCRKLYQPAAAAEERFKNKMASGDKSIPNDQQSRLARFEKGDELLSQQEENRIAQEAEKLERTRKKVEEMWQSLE
ncbi:hypothetical protein Ndes2526B_g01901 [Nannochloris sp. 'desiccata']